MSSGPHVFLLGTLLIVELALALASLHFLVYALAGHQRGGFATSRESIDT